MCNCPKETQTLGGFIWTSTNHTEECKTPFRDSLTLSGYYETKED